MFSDSLPFPGHQWPVKNPSRQRAHSPFFIFGHPRSGTTLLRSLLVRHPDVFIPPENPALWRMIREFGGRRSAPWTKVVDAVVESFATGYEADTWGLSLPEVKARALALSPRDRSLARLLALFYECYGERYARGKPIWGDKTTPGEFVYLDKLDRVFPVAAAIHIVRDGRDCVASAMRAGFYNNNPEEAARAWRDNLQHCRRFAVSRRSHGLFLEVRYEELVQAPEAVLARICALLGLALDPGMLVVNDAALQGMPDVGVLPQHANVHRPLFTASIGRWESEFNASQRDSLERIMGRELRRSGYLS